MDNNQSTKTSIKTPMKMLETYQWTIYPLGYINIGCNEEYNELNSFYNEKEKVLEVINLQDSDNLDITKRIADLSTPDTESIQKILKEQKKQNKGAKVIRSMQTVAGDTNRNNKNSKRILVKRTSFDTLTQLPYIPGSSIKGAIRTAVLNAIYDEKKKENTLKFSATQKDKENKKEVGKTFEKLSQELLGYSKVEEDRFKNIKIGDAHLINREAVKNNVSKICYETAVNKKAKEVSLSNILEVIKPYRPNNPVAFRLNVQLEKDTLIKFREQIHGYYKKFFLKEREFFDKNNQSRKELFAESYNLISQLEKDEKGFLLKIGRHTGAEAITIEDVAHIKNSKPGKDIEVSYGNFSHALWMTIDRTVNQKNSEEIRDDDNMGFFGWVFVAFEPLK